ncbi:peroxidase 57-like [Cornus florida]|uniref:peroxidase 57-like n=1 Tax=Cornus florida TaxID=4283 RepID=UPI00289A3775|nr:peroxidase 57-like [Cornus florida]
MRAEASQMAGLVLACLVVLVVALQVNKALSLELHFYRNSCPQAELVVKRIAQKHFSNDPSLPAGFLRLHFHDCFIRGCDASVLIDSTDENVAEKEAPPNLTLRGFEVIDEIKSELEKQCKGIVSCADILALATRDGVAFAGGSAYALPTGRRDGTISIFSDVHIPGPSFSIADASKAFQTINLDLTDLTTLLGAHAIGFCHCGFFVQRLYNFRGSGLSDPSMDSNFLDFLRKSCPKPVEQNTNISADPKVFMTAKTSTPFKLDTAFYSGLLEEEAVLQLDQDLAFTDITRKIASDYVNRPKMFRRKFAEAMIKLGNVGVLTGQEGEIRLNCRRVNNPTSQ